MAYVMHTCWILCAYMTAAWRMWALAAAFYLVAIFHRMSLGVASIDAAERFGVTTSTIAVLSTVQSARTWVPDPSGVARRPDRPAAVVDARPDGHGAR